MVDYFHLKGALFDDAFDAQYVQIQNGRKAPVKCGLVGIEWWPKSDLLGFNVKESIKNKLQYIAIDKTENSLKQTINCCQQCIAHAEYRCTTETVMESIQTEAHWQLYP